MEKQTKTLYTFNGAVKVYDRIAAHHWKAETWAASKAKAKSNLLYQFRCSMGYIASIPVTLVGDPVPVFPQPSSQ